MYHIVTDLETRFKSLKDVLVPRVLFPSVPVTAAPGEDISTPRVVAAKTIEQCITAIGVLGRFRRCLAGNESCKSYAETLDEAYPVLVLELPDKSAFFKWISPSTDQVPDVKKTHEKWSMAPVPVVRGEIRWLGPYSLKINEDTCVCRKATFLDGPEGKDHPWINGRGHPLDSGQMDYEPWPGNTSKRNSSLDMFLFRENHTRLRLPVYVVPDGNAYATCRPSGLYPKKENQIQFPIRIPMEKLRPFTGFYDKNGEPLFLDDPVRTDGNDQCVVLGMPAGPALCLYGRPKIPFLYELPREDMRLRNVSLALDKI